MSDDQPRPYPPPIQTATVIRPGDRVLVAVGSGMDLSQSVRMGNQLKAQFPDVTFVVVEAALAVYPAVDREDPA
jgi:hypothetical protein